MFLLSGQRACSWLAAQNCIVGLKAPQTYRQEDGGYITKVHQSLVIVSGDAFPHSVLKKWQEERPEGTIYHPLSNDEKMRVTDFCNQVQIDN
ncbi:MAG: hypothetical protein V7750_11315 [Sneathiella sp.]